MERPPRPKPPVPLRQTGEVKTSLKKDTKETKMNLADDVDQWNTAIEEYYNGNLEDAVSSLEEVNKTAKIEYNIGFIYMFRQDIKSSNQYFLEAVKRDPHLSIAHFALGINYYNQNRFKDALSSFEQAKKGLRNSKVLDYKQLGLNFQLTYSEIMLNMGITQAKQGHEERARVSMLKALESKEAKEYGVINDALDRLQGGYPLTLVQLPYNAIFRPPKSAVDNVKKRDYLGKAKVLFSANAKDTSAGFSGLQKFKERRQSLMDEIQDPKRKESLKKTKTPPQKPLPTMGKVLDSPPNGRQRRPLSVALSQDGMNTQERRAMFKKRHLSDLDEPVAFVEHHIILPPPDYEDEVVETAPQRPPKSPGVRPKSKEVFDTVHERPECPVKPLPRKPAPQRPESPSLNARKLSNMSKHSSGELQLQLQFSFACKVTVSDDYTFDDILKEVKSQPIPKELEICYTDDLGRQHTLNEEQWNNLPGHKRSTLKFLCFGSNILRFT